MANPLDMGNQQVKNVADPSDAQDVATKAHVAASAVPAARTITAGSGLSGGGDLSTNRTLDVNVDGSTLEINSDTLRIKDAGVTEAKFGLSDVSTANSSTAMHGLLKKLDGNAAHYMGGDGNWSTPAGTATGMATDPLWDAKGDIAAATGADAAIKVGVGSDGQVLTADAASTAGVKWAAAASSGLPTDGWNAITSLAYSSVDGVTGVVTTPGDISGTVGVGARVKYTQSAAVKYGIVTAIDSTTMTIYGGTDYALTSASLSNCYWSPVKAPFGFPLDPTKWTVTATDTNNRTQATPTQNTWYNLGSFSVDIPIGCWRVFFAVCMQVSKGTAATLAIHSALSTANNSASDSLMIASAFQSSPTAVEAPVFRERSLPLLLASKTTYYLNGRTTEASMSAIQFRGDVNTTTISAVCAYL